jgi:PIN domain nuclease of toxin-antitoxin system
MRALLDTRTFLRWNADDPQLSPRASEIISDGKNEIFLSAASVWEIAIKAAKGRLVLPESPSLYIPDRMSLYRIQPLPVQVSHALHVYDLPPYHADPFDRLLIAQSQLESLPIITADGDFQQYDVEILW